MISKYEIQWFLMMMPHGGCIFWYTRIYLYKYDYVMNFNLMVMLRSITGPYGRPVIEVAYGEMIFSLHRGSLEDDNLGRVVGVSTWCIAHIWHIRVNTSVGSVYTIFWFPRYKNLCIGITFSKSICSIKEHWWSLTCLGPIRFRECFRLPMSFQNRIWTTDDFMFYIVYEFYE